MGAQFFAEYRDGSIGVANLVAFVENGVFPLCWNEEPGIGLQSRVGGYKHMPVSHHLVNNALCSFVRLAQLLRSLVVLDLFQVVFNACFALDVKHATP